MRHLVDTGVEKDYKLIIKDNNGRIVPLTSYGENLMKNIGVVKRTVVKIKPGEELKGEIEVSKAYAMVNAGTYSITAKRNVSKQGDTSLAEVISNTIQIKIIK